MTVATSDVGVIRNAEQTWVGVQLFGWAVSPLEILMCCSVYLLLTTVLRLVQRKPRVAVGQRIEVITARALGGPWNFPVVGYLPKLGSRPFVTMWNLSLRYGSVYRIRMGSHAAVIINGEEMLKVAFVRQGKVFSGRPRFASFQELSRGKSLTFQSYCPLWRIHNKIAVRALCSFVNSKNRPVDGLILRNALWLTDQFLSKTGTPLDAYEFIEDSVLRVIYGLCFGDAVDGEFCAAMKSELSVLRTTMMRVLASDMMPWLSKLTRPYFERFRKTSLRLAALVDDLISRVQKKNPAAESTCIVHSLVSAWEDLRTNDAECPRPIEKDQILTTIQDLIGGGSEGVLNFVYWSIRYMIVYPAIQERLRAEVRDAISLDLDLDHDLASPVDRTATPFTEAFVWEVIRHSNMSPLTLPHSTLEDTVLGGYFIPRDTLVFGNLYSASHDPKIWPEPDRFLPGRFLDESGRKVDRAKLERLFCFGLGKRKCIGEFLGRMEMFIFLVVILQRCRFSPVEGDLLDMEGEMSLTYRSKPYKVIVDKI